MKRFTASNIPAWIVPFISFIIVVIGCSYALLNRDFFRVHDYIHGARVVEMSRALSDGHIIPRWSQNFGFGYGMPLFEFYAPLPYFIGALLYLSGLPMIIVLKVLFLICNIFTALGAYLLGKKLFNSQIAGILIMSSITLAPYRAVNLFVRGALSEAWGLMCIPWILYGIISIFKKERYGFQITTIATAALFLSHNLTSMIALPSIGIFILICIFQACLLYKKSVQNNLYSHVIQSFLKVCVAGLLGLGLSAFYTIPALIEKNYTKVESAVTGGYFDYNLHFVYLRQFVSDNWQYGGSTWGPDDGISFFLGLPQLILIGISFLTLFFYAFKLWKNHEIKKNVYLYLSMFLIVCGVCINLLMATEKTKIIWDAVHAFAYIQFPWRWLSATLIWVGLAGGASSIILFSKSKKLMWIISLSFILFTAFYNGRYFYPEYFVSDFNSLYYTDPYKISTEMSKTLYDYMPQAVPIDYPAPEQLVTCGETPLVFKQLCPQATVVSERVSEKLISFKTQNSLEATIAIADFPGWTVELDGQKIEHTTTENGFIAVSVPKGEHTVGVYFASTPVRKIADFISFLSLGIFVGIYFSLNQHTIAIQKSKKHV